ncbi:hypothetical protein D9V41_07590 [Aeromicrobium phragmitis]|uniref:EfeO-type cupredoxin-like domain-containing protein n=1 Tax=Aeromicrobium phragmitis TaxID=2478914 RepID=A0A3L8PQH1_9ACTN|nr:hypothetical protein [Aeromicrobium phragmitis]RLV56282.1 hypothetical protein D9V41_07590 [Aeromicrobium phragmitis]
MKVLAALLILAVVAGCGSSAPAPPSTEPLSDIAVGLTEWSVATSTSTAKEGEVRMRVTNAGGTTHDLVVTGERGRWSTPKLAPGEQFELVVEAVAGEQLHLECTRRGHRGQGMWTTLDVAAS